MNEQTVHQANLANQRKAALRFISAHPNIEIIRFTHEGDRPGFGASWSANAVVTVDGKEYQEIPGLGVMGGDPLPSASPGAAPGPVTLIYSDGSSEVLP